MAEDQRVTVITVVYASTPKVERVVRRCMSATKREFAEDVRIAPIDYAPAQLEAWIVENGWIVLKPHLGDKPPRLKELLAGAVRLCDTEVVWTIEHDAEIAGGTREAVEAQLAAHPEVAGIDCLTMNPMGHVGYPSGTKLRSPKGFGLSEYKDDLTRVAKHISLNCTCWRTKALREIDWDRVPEFPACDKGVSAEVRRGDWILCMTKHPCIHLCARARRLPAPALTL